MFVGGDGIQGEANRCKHDGQKSSPRVLLCWPVPCTIPRAQSIELQKPKHNRVPVDVDMDSPGSSKAITSHGGGTLKVQARSILPPLELQAFEKLCTSVRAHIEDTQVSLDDEAADSFFIIGLRAVIKSAFLVPVKGAKPANVIPVPATPEKNCLICAGSILCICPRIIQLFKETNKVIKDRNLVNTFTAPRMYKLIRNQITLRVEQGCIGKYECRHVDALFKWLDLMIPWITIIYRLSPLAKKNIVKAKEELELKMLLLEVYGNAIVKELFSVIIEYPDSKPVLDDLRICMRRVNLRNTLVIKLKSELKRRLLNAGVSTTDVLDAYVSTVRALKYVDPSGILVQLVTPPVRKYLKNRDETVRVILVSLTEESGDLSDELSRNPTSQERRAKIDPTTWREWVPDPIDVPKDKHNLRKSDLIQALVSIYGSKTLFIDEYRALLADRLLRMPKPGSLTREIKCLELLKLRFGEADLQKCEVMLKDVSDSQRMNTRFYEEEGAVLANQEIDVTGLIVSAQFWPTFKQEALELPEPVKKALENYTKAFEMIKGNRSLEWQRHIGTVDIEIEHGGAVLNFAVTPAQATIIYHFQEKESWTLEELAKVTEIPASSLRGRINFWVSKGILLHTKPDIYHLHSTFNSDNRKTTGESSNRYIEDEEIGSPTISISSQRQNELQVFWSYIEGMLTNLDSLPLSRIHSMLKLFATVECSLEELQKFLDEKVVQNFLVFSSGQYQLPK